MTQKLDLANEHAVVIGDSFGPVPFNLNRSGFDWTGTVIKFNVYRRDLADPIFTKTIPWTNASPDKLEFQLHLEPADTATVRSGEYKYSVRIVWPNGTDENTIIHGLIQFKKI